MDDRIQALGCQNQSLCATSSAARSPGELAQCAAVAEVEAAGAGSTEGSRDKHLIPSSFVKFPRQYIQTSVTTGSTSPSKQRAAMEMISAQRSAEDTDGSSTQDKAHRTTWTGAWEDDEHDSADDKKEDDFSRMLKLKAAEALFKKSLVHGSEVLRRFRSDSLVRP